jgi:RNA polymerase sigma-70 factor, ECF subfamily
MPRMESQEQTMPRSFEEVVLPHLDAAFNYARWLTKNDADAEDARAWLLTIVRNTWYGRFRDAREVP